MERHGDAPAGTAPSEWPVRSVGVAGCLAVILRRGVGLPRGKGRRSTSTHSTATGLRETMSGIGPHRGHPSAGKRRRKILGRRMRGTGSSSPRLDQDHEKSGTRAPRSRDPPRAARAPGPWDSTGRSLLATTPSIARPQEPGLPDHSSQRSAGGARTLISASARRLTSSDLASLTVQTTRSPGKT